MRKTIQRIIMILLLAVFLFAVYNIISILLQYKKGQETYKKAASSYTMEGIAPDASEEDPENSEEEAQKDKKKHIAPIQVDFEKLQKENPDVIGWIYCKGTNLNYPVLQGETNDTYLRHTYDGAYNIAGSIFIEAGNARDFSDINTIMYGHNMQDKSMFSQIEKWSDDGYVKKHPYIWLLTPERDYRIQVFSGYTTSAYSDTYVLFGSRGEDLEKYMQQVQDLSDFKTDVVLNPSEDHYLMMSTCAYIFDNARYVLHGILKPADSAGGKSLE